MKRHMMTLLAGLIAMPGLAAAADSATFTDAQQQAIGKIASDYIIAHPEVLVQASQKLQAQQQQQQASDSLTAVLANAPALLQDKDTPSYGPKDAKVAFVEFFDYQCLYCSHMAPLVEQTIKANPNVRFVFKEWPIFGDRWKASITAAETGLNIIKTKNLKLSKGGPVMKPILILTTGDVALPALRDYFGKIEPLDTYVNDLPTNYSDDKDELEKV